MLKKLFENSLELDEYLQEIEITTDDLSPHQKKVLQNIQGNLQDIFSNLKLLEETPENILVLKNEKEAQMTYVRYAMLRQLIIKNP